MGLPADHFIFLRKLCRYWLQTLFFPERHLHSHYRSFRNLLENDGQAHTLISELTAALSGDNPVDERRLLLICREIARISGKMVAHLIEMRPACYQHLAQKHRQINAEIETLLSTQAVNLAPPYMLTLEQAADYPYLTGGKAANLSEVGRLGVPIPRGFVITTSASHRLFHENRLTEVIDSHFRDLSSCDHQMLTTVADDVQHRILESKVPEDVIAQINSGLSGLEPARVFAVRSSALAEDGSISFAGQYVSELAVGTDEITAAYKRVLAGKYSPHAIAYRIRHGMSDADTAMAVLVVPMILPRVSGVVYTKDPAPPVEGESVGVYAVAGLAKNLVDGTQIPEKYHLSRTSHSIYSCEQTGSSGPLLGQEELLQLKDWALILEKHHHCAQDIEWALDETGVTILQCRRLYQQQDPAPAIATQEDLSHLLYDGLHCAAPGIACGQIKVIETMKDFGAIIPGSVVITRTLQPSYTQFLDHVSAVVSASGSRASHFAAVAREQGIPVVVGNNIALRSGLLVTIDAAAGRIFEGCVSSMLQASSMAKESPYPTEKHSHLTARTSKLHLLNVDSDNFAAERCQSLHDIVRFCHEMSVREMFTFGDRRGRGISKARKLITDLPLAIYLLDLDQTDGPSSSPIQIESITSLPMLAFWRGLADRRIAWDSGEANLDWEQFDQISGGIFSHDSRVLASYAITSQDYLHLNIRFGYHFSLVDTLCSDNPETNYINFHFRGGGAALDQQGYRLEFIEQVLSRLGFETKIHGDSLDSSFARAPLTATEKALTRLGLLLSVTRRMDIRLTSSEQASHEAERFLTMSAETL